MHAGNEGWQMCTLGRAGTDPSATSAEKSSLDGKQYGSVYSAMKARRNRSYPPPPK